MTTYSYFPGCSANSTGISYTKSADFVCKKIGIELEEIPEWCCCGTSAAKLTSYDLGYALPSRSLALAEKLDASRPIVAPCAGCYAALKDALVYAQASKENLEHVRDMINMPYEASVQVMNLLEVFSTQEAKDALQQQITKPLSAFKVACYYGCALVRPVEVCKFDDPEDPQSMDTIMRLAGAEPIDWSFKTECCGAAQQMAVPKPSRVLIERIFQNAEANGANAIVTACPLCWMNLDMRVKAINKERAEAGKPAFDLPVFFFTELLGVALGGDAKTLGIDVHFQPGAPAFIDQKVKESAQIEEERKLAAAEEARKLEERAAKLAAKKQAKAEDVHSPQGGEQ
ncbi:MAG: CoB--CoM heterodisulfide reductase iron-sulfur subunit B family protein [Coriobacteriales bacterium]|nr:CoB--CoM heterodisulfide reductase iron-sulfur subunit B family protein [Coriobacteriales bacterium]